LKFNIVLEAVEVHVSAKVHEAKCSVNSALDFRQL